MGQRLFKLGTTLSEGRKKFHRRCDKKRSWNQNNSTCQKCRTNSKITRGDLQSAPDNCPMLDSFAALIPGLATAAASYATLLTPALGAYQKVMQQIARQQVAMISATQRVLIGSVAPALNVYETFTKTITILFEATKFLHEDEFKKFEYNWVSFLSISDIKALYDLWKAEKEDEVREFFLKMFSSKENIDQLISIIEKNPLFEPRMHIIKEALYAHLEGHYALSIPVLWSQIDGVFLKVFGKVLSGKSEICKTCGRPLVFPNAKNIAKELLPKKSEFMPTYLEHIARSYSHERVGISHGLDIEYPCPNRSTKLILALLVLYYSLEKRR